MQVPGDDRLAGGERVVSGSVNPAPDPMLYNHVIVDKERPAGFPEWEMILQGSPIDAGILWSNVGESRIEPRIMIAQRPVERTRRPDDLLYLAESFLGGFDLFYQCGSLLPADRGVPGDQSSVELVTIL